MTDTVTTEERSRIMRSVRGRGNASTELKLVRLFREQKITGWRRQWPIAGKPDLVFPKHKIAVFVDGCFWHGCPQHLRMPSSNVDYWQGKVSRNMERDKRVTADLKRKGWRVLRIWEHEIKEPQKVLRWLARITRDA